MLITVAILVVGLVFLIKGADFLVEGASSIALRFGIPEIVVGMTVVAFGTSAPELVVNVLSSFEGAAELAVGNIIGSNIANILLILGVSGLLAPIAADKLMLKFELPVHLLLIPFLYALLWIAPTTEGWIIARTGATILLMFFAVFFFFNYKFRKDHACDELPDEMMTVPKASLFLILGLVGLGVGGKFIVDSAIDIASALGMSQALIGLTVVAIGTSLPELAASATAAYKGKTDIALGNVVGSNMFNVAWVLGISAMIRPLPVATAQGYDLIITAVCGVLLWLVFVVSPKREMGKKVGILFLVLYVSYTVYLVMREQGLGA